jgi:hypothetical protein
MKPKQSRNARGQFSARPAAGQMGPPGGTGRGGISAVDGMHIPNVEDRSVLFRQDDPWAIEQVHWVAPNWGRNDARTSHEGLADFQAYVNHQNNCAGC